MVEGELTPPQAVNVDKGKAFSALNLYQLLRQKLEIIYVL